jgi:hypothetical protein
MRCTDNDYSHTTESESSVQPGSKSKAKTYRKNSKPCARRDHNHTNPEYVWGDEGPVNERQELPKRTLQRSGVSQFDGHAEKNTLMSAEPFMSALRQKRTLQQIPSLSALPSKADFGQL